MKYTTRFRSEVVADLEEACKWYDARKSGLGGEFLSQCKAALDRIVEDPESTSSDLGGVRSARLRRFPYVVHYSIKGSVIVVFAIMYGGRDPSAWQERI